MNSLYHGGILIVCSMLNLATGGISIAILNAQDYWKDMPSVVIIACSSMLCGLLQLGEVLLKSSLIWALNLLVCLTTAITFSAAVSHCYQLLHTIGRSDRNIPIPLMTAQLGVLLATMLMNGMQLNSSIINLYNQQRHGTESLKPLNEDLEKGSIPLEQDDEKYVALKASAQTLTPELEAVLEKNWMNEYPHSGSDTTSTPSVIKHKLAYQMNGELSNKSSISKLRNTSFPNDTSPIARSQHVFEKLQRKFSIKSPTNKDKHLKTGSSALEPRNSFQPEINAKYVTRLSTIPDMSKSYLNILKQTNEVNSATSVCLKDSDDIDRSLLKMEKDALDLYDSVLLPSILHNSKMIEKSASQSASSLINEDNIKKKDYVKNDEDDDDDDELEKILEEDLQIRPLQVPHIFKGSVSQPNLRTDMKSNTITLNNWNENKSSLLEKEKQNQKQSDHMYLPYDFDTNFSFPSKKNSSHLAFVGSDAEEEIMTFVDEAIKPHDNQLMEEGLKQDSPSVNPLLYSQSIHSPTKSVSSVATATKTPVKFNSGAFSTEDTRDDSQISLYLNSNNSRQVFSAQSSPTRLSKRLSQRFSRVNLRYDDESHNNMHSHSKSLTLSGFHYRHHSETNSYTQIDLSYIHSLQQKHSPQRSVCTQNSRRRSSIYQSVSEIPKIESTNDELHPVSDSESLDIEEEEEEEDNDIDSALSFGAGREFVGVDTGLSEYDREKLSILVSRQQTLNKY